MVLLLFINFIKSLGRTIIAASAEIQKQTNGSLKLVRTIIRSVRKRIQTQWLTSYNDLFDDPVYKVHQ